jgi:hypothetical protein
MTEHNFRRVPDGYWFWYACACGWTSDRCEQGNPIPNVQLVRHIAATEDNS